MSSEQKKGVYHFSKLSITRLSTCHVELQRLMHAVMNKQAMDFSVLCGFRDKHDQNLAVKRGHSKLCWPYGRHNHLPSLAVDVAAYPINNFDKENTQRTKVLAALIEATARELKIPVFWGGHWTHLDDIYHFQLPEHYAETKSEKEQPQTMPIVRPNNSVSFMTCY